jgi:hypothetical protein
MQELQELKQKIIETQSGVAIPIILWLLGVPGVIVILLWLFMR